MPDTNTVNPKGVPLTPEQLSELAVIWRKDLDEAVGRSHPSIKSYLEAQSK